MNGHPRRDKAREFCEDVADILKDEWTCRTAWGKLWYPVWLFMAIFQWAVALSVLALLAVASVFIRALTSRPVKDSGIFPETYK